MRLYFALFLLSVDVAEQPKVELSGPGPGDNGRPVIIPQERQSEATELFKINQFNLLASDLVSLNRTLPDHRLDGCVLHSVSLWNIL